MQLAIERALESWLASGRCRIGQILIEKSTADDFRLCHIDDAGRRDLVDEPAAAGIATFDDAGFYRPLKTAPNLRHGWRLKLKGVPTLRLTLDTFYPGRLAAFLAFEKQTLRTTPLRETLDRQTGMYRVAANISDAQLDDVVADFCRSDGGCLRTVLWKRDADGSVASKRLPPQKFEPAHDQTGKGEFSIPLICQEGCNLLVNAMREEVKAK
jgi:sirohydrochlorin cobaltochelatase